MTTYSTFADRLGQYDQEMFFGYLCWYAVSDSCNVDHSEFCKYVANAGNGAAGFSLPNQPHPADVFRRVTTANARKKQQTPDPNVFNNFTFVEVGKDDDYIWRLLVMQTVDTDGHQLAHENLWEVRFNRGTETITNTPIIPDPPGQAIVDKVVDDFKDVYYRLAPMTIRTWIRNTFSTLEATTVRPSGGVYFVPEKHAYEMDALDKVISAVPSASFHYLPLVDDEKQKGMIKEAFEDESTGDVDQLIADMTEILKSGKKISADKHADFVMEWRRLKDKMDTYSSVLKDNLGETAARIDILQQIITNDLVGIIK